jgi:crotonobetainyl-CoA:carnitine CoA-transferase CaiB-like acyl-CoA transferase
MRALHGIRILDLTHMLSGPYAAMMLADLGADTIKVEPPKTGEGTRTLLANDPKNSVEGMGAYFLTLNRNKRSVAIDLKSAEGLSLFYELVKVSDVVLYNFSAGVADRLKISYPHLSARNSAIITCSITGFGETGPHKDWVSFDMVAQGTGGGMSITGQPGGEPTRSGIPIGDLGGSVMGAIGVLAALQARHTTGLGQHVDISMQDAQVSLLNYMATMHFLSGEVPTALGNRHFVHVPYGTFAAKDGYLIVAVITDGFWKSLVQVLELPELDTEAHARQPGRLANREQIERVLGERFRTNTKAFWLERMRAARIPCAPVNDLAEALSDPQVAARNMVVDVPHPSGRVTKQPGNPIKLSRTHEDSFTAPPLLGQHTDEVLKSLLGLSPEKLRALREQGVVG